MGRKKIATKANKGNGFQKGHEESTAAAQRNRELIVKQHALIEQGEQLVARLTNQLENRDATIRELRIANETWEHTANDALNITAGQLDRLRTNLRLVESRNIDLQNAYKAAKLTESAANFRIVVFPKKSTTATDD